MADEETEKEWKKSKRIEAEQMKAVRALAEEKPDKINLAFLDPKTTKTRGWSSDLDVILASIERMGNRAIFLAMGGIVLSIIGYVGGIVTFVSNLGLAGVMISSLPSGVGMFGIGVAVLMSLIVIGGEIVFKIRFGRRIGTSFWTAIGALGLVAIYMIVMQMILRVI